MRNIRGNLRSNPNQKYTWKRRPSEIRGYQRTLYLNDDNGDYLRVDYSIKEKRVRLYIEISEEGGNPYYSVILNGKISAERSVSSGRSHGFSDKFQSRAEIFSTIPHRDVLRLINSNYNIKLGLNEELARIEEKARAESEKRREETRKKYFKSDINPYVKKRNFLRGRGYNVALVDIFDFLIGFLLSGIFFIYFQYSFIAMGIISAFFGVIIGFTDLIIRRRSTLIIKILFFVASGISSYIYGYYFS